MVVPAILPSSRDDLEKKLALFVTVPVRRIQIDIVDGQFASPASWPYTKPAELREMLNQQITLPHAGRVEYEIDIMGRHPEDAARAWLAIGASRLTFHAESVANIRQFLPDIRKKFGEFVPLGLALSLGSSLALIEPCMDQIDYVQCMGIANIGRQGQPFDRRVFEKVRILRARYPTIPVQVDGGVSLEHGKELVRLGVSNLVVGSALLGASNPALALQEFEKIV